MQKQNKDLHSSLHSFISTSTERARELKFVESNRSRLRIGGITEFSLVFAFLNGGLCFFLRLFRSGLALCVYSNSFFVIQSEKTPPVVPFCVWLWWCALLIQNGDQLLMLSLSPSKYVSCCVYILLCIYFACDLFVSSLVVTNKI